MPAHDIIDNRTEKLIGHFGRMLGPSELAHYDAIIGLVCGILAAKAADPAADTSELEREFDRIVYKVYGLMDEEIAIVEGAAGKGEK